VSRFVLDASGCLDLVLASENIDLAQRVADRLKQGDTALAPSIWPHEELNALLAREKRKRISEAMIQSFLDDLAALPVMLEQIPAGIVFDRIQSLSREHGLTAYDAAYLDLALENGLGLATLDETLLRACKNVGATSLWV
jgi:predicted nucleic acid-binding protein